MQTDPTARHSPIGLFQCVCYLVYLVRDTRRRQPVGRYHQHFALHQYGEWLLFQLGGSDSGWMFQVKAVVKHVLEVAGWFVIALGLAVGLREHDRLRVPV